MLTFYDSGIGGLTIVKEYMQLNPGANFQYYSDYDVLPLGDKSKTQIVDQIKSVATKAFESSNLLVLACNTASVNSIRELQQIWLPQNFPTKQILSISKPITELLESQYGEFKNQNLVILATEATINSGFYQCELEQLGFEHVKGIACAGLCELIEDLINAKEPKITSKFLTYNSVKSMIAQIQSPKPSTLALKNYLTDLKLPKKTLVVLACTHYPIIKDLIQTTYPQATVVDPSQFIAQKLIQYQAKHPEYWPKTAF